jgi:PIN domain nuclease of toxin-antitoxin system
LIYLDTHIVVWLYAGLTEKFSNLAKSLINEHDLYISTIVRLELKYLYEIERFATLPEIILLDLKNRLGLGICKKDFNESVSQALGMDWTRDPFLVPNCGSGCFK